MRAQMSQKLPVDIQSFEVMRGEHYLYVDKTWYIFRMVTEGKFYFLSRPRRFGKSLLVSTLACLFQGRKELFEGLWIAEQGTWDWNAHPIIGLDFNRIPGRTSEELKQGLSFHLAKIAQEYGVTLDAPLLELQFDELILKLYDTTGMQVVVLIDEYDKRMIDHLGKGKQRLETGKTNRDILKSFFGVLKGQEVSAKLRFVFLTGVSRFSRVSIFSELNNLRDITMSLSYADMLGYTQEELENNFQPYIEQLAEKFGWSVDQVLTTLARQYNGYRFSKKDIRVYNPFSILNAFQELDFGEYWFETATPTFLIQLLKQEHYEFPEIENLEMDHSMTTYDLEDLRPEVLLFQTGYVTIKDIKDGLYILDYPNREVKQAFVKHLLSSLQHGIDRKIRSHVFQLPDYLEQEKFEAFFDTMQAIFASIPYDIEAKRDEAYFHTIFYLVMSASGMTVQSSVLTCEGRIDLVVIFPEQIYIMEFKCNQSAETALQQIQDQNYAEKYRGSGKKIILVGINFNKEKRNLEEWKIQYDND
jgi:hypothetical protein